MNFFIFLKNLSPLTLNPISRSISTRQGHLLKYSPLSRNIEKLYLPCTLNQKTHSRPYTYGDAPKYTIPKKRDSYTSIWVVERVFSIIAIPSSICLFLYPCENTELIWGVIVAIHAHWGLEAIFVDYIRPSVVGNTLPKYNFIFSGLISAMILMTLVWTASNGNGIFKSIQQLWYLDVNRNPYPVVKSRN